jgi:hypothetical protein
MEDGLTRNLLPHTEKQLCSSHFFLKKKAVLTLARPSGWVPPFRFSPDSQSYVFAKEFRVCLVKFRSLTLSLISSILWCSRSSWFRVEKWFLSTPCQNLCRFLLFACGGVILMEHVLYGALSNDLIIKDKDKEWKYYNKYTLDILNEQVLGNVFSGSHGEVL